MTHDNANHENEEAASVALRRFVHTGAAWYASTALAETAHVDEVLFGLYAEEGGSVTGTEGEAAMRWYHLGIGDDPVARLEIFDPSFHMIGVFRDVIAVLVERSGGQITPAQFCQLLREHGVHDATPRTQPDEPGGGLSSERVQ